MADDNEDDFDISAISVGTNIGGSVGLGQSGIINNSNNYGIISQTGFFSPTIQISGEESLVDAAFELVESVVNKYGITKDTQFVCPHMQYLYRILREYYGKFPDHE